MNSSSYWKLAGWAILYSLLLAILFVGPIAIGKYPMEDILIVMGTAVIITIVSVVFGLNIARETAKLSDKTLVLQNNLLDLQRISGAFVSDDVLKDIESRATRIRVISPDLKDDREHFFQTVLENIKANKSYDYVIPDRGGLVNEMERLIHRLKEIAGVPADGHIPVRYKALPDTQCPIISEYVIYDLPEFHELQGYEEVKTRATGIPNGNVRLTRDETNELNGWIDRIFAEA